MPVRAKGESDPDTVPFLERQLGYQLRRASATLLGELAQSLAELDLRIADATILHLIDEQPDITQSTLGRMLALFTATSAMAQTAAQTKIFVGCPVLRNTTLPCWMGVSEGELYYLGPQGDLGADFYPPEFQHRMLVEGTVSDEPRICGGVVLKPVKVSVLPDVDASCNVMLPAEGYVDPPNNRGSGPSGVRGAAAPPPPPPRPAPPQITGPFKATRFDATFDADSDRMWRPAQTAITAAARYAIAAKASEVQVTGFRSQIRMSDGKDFVEKDSVAENRAKDVEVALRTLGVPDSTRIKVSWRQAPVRADGIQADIQGRKVSILVMP